MNYDFDRIINRNGTNSYKWDYVKRDGVVVPWDETDTGRHEKPVLPLWVADMDFPCPQPVVDVVTDIARMGVYGYAFPPPSYYDAVVRWMKRRHGWTVDPTLYVLHPASYPPCTCWSRPTRSQATRYWFNRRCTTHSSTPSRISRRSRR